MNKPPPIETALADFAWQCQGKLSQSSNLITTQHSPNGALIPDGGINSHLEVRIAGTSREKYIGQFEDFWQHCWLQVELSEKSGAHVETKASKLVLFENQSQLVVYPDIIISKLKRNTKYIWRARTATNYVRCAKNEGHGLFYSSGDTAFGDWMPGAEFTTTDYSWEVIPVSNVEVKYGAVKSGDKTALERKHDGVHLEVSTASVDNGGQIDQYLELEITFSYAPDNLEQFRINYNGRYTKFGVSRFAFDVWAWRQGWVIFYEETDRGRFSYFWSSVNYPPEYAEIFKGPDGSIKARVRLLDYNEGAVQELLSDFLQVEGYA